MQADEFAQLVRDRLQSMGENPHHVAISGGLPKDAVSSVLAGRRPSIERVSEICAALGLEFYIGLPREPSPPPEGPRRSRPDADFTTWPVGLLRFLVEYFEELPDECPLAGPEGCPLLEKAKEWRQRR